MSRSEPTVLSVEDARKAFGALVAVNNVSFSVEQGEIFGIAGPNGSGKSTLFNIISGVPYAADAGRFVLAGQEITGLRAHLRFRRGLARTFQTETAFDCLSVEENVDLARVYGPVDAGRAYGVPEALELAKISRRTAAMSAGEISIFDKKKLMIATAVVARPKLLMLDEPAAGLTKTEIGELREVILELNRAGISIVLVEHVLPLLLSVARRVLVLNQGEEVMTGTPDEMINDPRVIEAYLGRKGHGHVSAA